MKKAIKSILVLSALAPQIRRMKNSIGYKLRNYGVKPSPKIVIAVLIGVIGFSVVSSFVLSEEDKRELLSASYMREVRGLLTDADRVKEDITSLVKDEEIDDELTNIVKELNKDKSTIENDEAVGIIKGILNKVKP